MHKLLFTAGLMLVAMAAAAEPVTEHEQRVRELEQRVKQLESNGAKSAPNNFNPAISLILDGKFSAFSQKPSTYALPGFTLGEGASPGDEGLGLGESELVMSANVDDWFYGQFIAALTPENKTEIEEAYFETLALGGGFTLRGGRFFSGIGYLNPVHAHAWDFADQPLVYRALLGNQYKDDGLQARWVAPTDLFLEIGAELFRGDAFPSGGASHNGKGTYTVFMHIGGDVGTSHAWRAGLAHFDTDAKNRATGDAAVPDLFTGSSTVNGVDFIWKWAPNGNPRARHVKLQAEYFTRNEDGRIDPASSGTPLAYRGKQQGWYTQAVYQFMPRWRAGLRVDQLKANAVDTALAGTVLDNRGHDPKRTSIMLDFSHSEFSRLRLQFNRDESRTRTADNQWYLQYIMSLGAHGAHAF